MQSPTIVIDKYVPVVRTARVMQMEGLFEVPPSERSEERWQVDMNIPDDNWNIGLIVGPSGSGKTTIANALWPDKIVSSWDWPVDKSVVDGFPDDMSVKEIIALLNSVGFSSPPSWVRPFRVLSNGEQFRVNLARTIAELPDFAVVDEFTSVVDRTVAQIGSAAVAKAVRKRNQRLVLLSCHFDIINWLEPDWVYKPHTNQFYNGRYLHPRQSINFSVRRVHHSAWKLFRKFHYLDMNLNKAAYCFCAFIDNLTPVAFCAVLPFPHAVSPGWRFHRLVCLPDYQGIGIGVRFADYVGSIFQSTGKPVFRTLAHPAVIHACANSPVWKMIRSPSRTAVVGKTSSIKKLGNTTADKRLTASFLYVGPSVSKDQAALVFNKYKGV